MEEQPTATMSQQEADDIDAALAAFQARCDRSDPQQLALLEQMLEHTRRLKQARGDWERPNARRNWNAPGGAGGRGTKPLAVESLRDYKDHLAAEQRRQQIMQQRPLPLLEGGAVGGSVAGAPAS